MWAVKSNNIVVAVTQDEEDAKAIARSWKRSRHPAAGLPVLRHPNVGITVCKTTYGYWNDMGIVVQQGGTPNAV